jgi:hypothetical protein
VPRLFSVGRGVARTLGDRDRATGRSTRRLFGLWPSNGPCTRREGADLGRSAMGGASGDAALCAAPAAVPAPWHPDRARELCRSACAVGTAIPPPHRARLSIDADQSCGGPACGEPGDSAARRPRLSKRGIGRGRNTGPAISVSMKFSAGKASILDGAVGPDTRRSHRAAEGSYRRQLAHVAQ